MKDSIDSPIQVTNCWSAEGPLTELSDGKCPFLCTEVGESFCLWAFCMDIEEPSEDELPEGCPLPGRDIHIVGKKS